MPLQQSHNKGLPDCVTAVGLTATGAYVASLALDERLVALDFSDKHLVKRAGLQCQPNAMLQEPRRFLSYSKVATDFVAANGILGAHYQPNGYKAFID
ncbi:MAG: hypothetical protein IT448_07590 [Phycisphaerales bacterium]|nr:hypothetical protein [Phycisphaerales bacterium]